MTAPAGSSPASTLAARRGTGRDPPTAPDTSAGQTPGDDGFASW